MNNFIRMQKVEAEPMKFGEFKDTYPKSGGANVDRGANDDGYVIFYRGGEYVSWCPKKEFEDVSRPCDGMTFGMAIEAMKRGKKVARRGWNGKGQFVTVGNQFTYVDCNGKQNAEHQTSGTAALIFHGTIGVQVGWLASQSDMLSDDWEIVE